MAGLFEKSQVGKREDLLDVLTIVDYKETPFLAECRRGPTPSNTYMEWPVDVYADPSLSGVVDGADVDSYENAAENRAILSTYLQTQRRTAKTSRLAQEVSDVAGVTDEQAAAIDKKYIELNRDIESVLLSSQEHQADDGTNPYLTRGLGTWILDTANIGGQTLHVVPADYRPSDGQVINTAAASLTETSIQDMLKAGFDNIGAPQGKLALFAGSTLRRAFTDFTRTVQTGSTNVMSASRSLNFDGMGDKIKHTTAVFEGDYGEVEIYSSSFIGWSGSSADLDRGYIVDMDKVMIRYNKQPEVERFDDQGGGPRFMVEARFALQCLNPKGLYQIQPGLS